MEDHDPQIPGQLALTLLSLAPLAPLAPALGLKFCCLREGLHRAHRSRTWHAVNPWLSTKLGGECGERSECGWGCTMKKSGN